MTRNKPIRTRYQRLQSCDNPILQDEFIHLAIKRSTISPLQHHSTIQSFPYTHGSSFFSKQSLLVTKFNQKSITIKSELLKRQRSHTSQQYQPTITVSEIHKAKRIDNHCLSAPNIKIVHRSSYTMDMQARTSGGMNIKCVPLLLEIIVTQA